MNVCKSPLFKQNLFKVLVLKNFDKKCRHYDFEQIHIAQEKFEVYLSIIKIKAVKRENYVYKFRSFIVK